MGKSFDIKKCKEFLVFMCNAEEITPKELQELTGKSKSVVYDWLNYNGTSFPSFESLSKIICRLGITLDDFINCKSNMMIDCKRNRSYSEYIKGTYENQYLLLDILDAPYYIFKLNGFISDCNDLKSMISEYLNGEKIDTKKFNLLCKLVKPVYVSDVMDEFTIMDYLKFSSLREYKKGTDFIKESIKEEDEYIFDVEHEIYLPNANDVFLAIALDNILLFKKYIQLQSNNEKAILLEDYLKKCIDDEKFDKKKIIFKTLLKYECTLRKNISENIKNTYDKFKSILENSNE